jgi:hypothetical protein
MDFGSIVNVLTGWWHGLNIQSLKIIFANYAELLASQQANVNHPRHHETIPVHK